MKAPGPWVLAVAVDVLPTEGPTAEVFLATKRAEVWETRVPEPW